MSHRWVDRRREKSQAIGSSQFDAKKLGAALRLIREGRGLSASEFAKLIGLTRQAVSILESGSAVPTIPTLEKVASVFGFTIPETVAFGLSAKASPNPAVQSAIGLITTLDPKTLRLAISLLRVLKRQAES